jgi:hypothetical protein
VSALSQEKIIVAGVSRNVLRPWPDRGTDDRRPSLPGDVHADYYFYLFFLLMQMHRTTELRCRFHERNAARAVSKSGVRATNTLLCARAAAAPNANGKGALR